MDCVAGFVSIPDCWIVWIVLLGCVDSGCQWIVWIPVCFSSFLSMGCMDSGVIPMWVGGCGSVAVWVKK